MVSAYMCVTDGERVIVGVKRNCCFWMKGGQLNPAFEGKRLPLVGKPPSEAYYIYKTGVPITNNPEQNVFPGGKMDRFETGKEAAMREWVEEMGVEALIPFAALRNGQCVKLDNLFYVNYVRVASDELDAICAGANNVLTSERRNWFRAEFLRRAFDNTHQRFMYEPPLYSDEMAEAKIYSIDQILTSDVFNVNEDEKLSGSYFLSAVRQMPSNMQTDCRLTTSNTSKQEPSGSIEAGFASL